MKIFFKGYFFYNQPSFSHCHRYGSFYLPCIFVVDDVWFVFVPDVRVNHDCNWAAAVSAATSVYTRIVNLAMCKMHFLLSTVLE